MLIRPIESADNAAIEQVVRQVLGEFDAVGPGFASSDPELNQMAETYQRATHRYLVVVIEEEIVGGGGVAPLAGGDNDTCELRKMYLLPKARGHGAGKLLLQQLLDAARGFGFLRCYLETLARMEAARALYRQFGFEDIDKPLGDTGHHGCNNWMLLERL